MTDDPHNLARFLSAQDGTFEQAVKELRAGRKTGHWMWFVFPQMRGLGVSATAEFYGVASVEEARAYLAHPTLGDRLERCVAAALEARGGTLRDVFGSPDDLKFRSCMTLFELAADDAGSIFSAAIDALCDGRRDQRTVDLAGRT